jgi:hypothetical protein
LSFPNRFGPYILWALGQHDTKGPCL